MAKTLKYHQNGSPNPSEIDEKSRLRRGCVLGSFFRATWAEKGAGDIVFGTLLATIFHQKSNRCHPKKHLKIDAEKVMNIDAKRIENDAKMATKIYDFSYFLEKGENARNHCIYKLKRGSGHVKSYEKSV